MREVNGTKILVNVEEAMEALSIGRSKLLELTYEGKLPTIKVGRRRLYPLDRLQKWVEDEMIKSGGE